MSRTNCNHGNRWRQTEGWMARGETKWSRQREGGREGQPRKERERGEERGDGGIDNRDILKPGYTFEAFIYQRNQIRS